VRILYVFPHPDDESYGPSRAMAAQRRSGHEVHLLTLTRGEATKVRHKLGLTLEQMGAARHREMLEMAKVLDLTGMRVLELPDSGLKELDPWAIEQIIRDEILRLRPHVVITYPIHGISGFHDHIVTHTTVTRVFLELRGADHPWLQRLAFFTLAMLPKDFPWHLNVTKPEEIDCSFDVTDAEMDRYHRALDCYVTYADVIAETRIHDVFGKDVHFEIYRENHEPPLADLCDGLAEE
jgi:LmbE family N-acetylglucosaminyl deacetylase